MSLLCALRTGPAVLLLADSQETHGRSRRTKVSKLKVYRTADGDSVQVAYVAAGNSGPFIDFLGDKIGRWTRRTQSKLAADIEQELREIVRRHYHGKSNSAHGKQRDIQGVICVAPKGHSHTLLYEFTRDSLMLNTRDDAAFLRGIDYGSMKTVLKRYYRPNMPRGSTGVLGVYVMWKVKQVSSWVGLATAAVEAAPEGFRRYDEKQVQIVERGIEDLFGLRVSTRALLAAANLAVPDSTVKRLVGDKWDRVAHIRSVMMREVKVHARARDKEWLVTLRAQFVPATQ